MTAGIIRKTVQETVTKHAVQISATAGVDWKERCEASERRRIASEQLHETAKYNNTDLESMIRTPDRHPKERTSDMPVVWTAAAPGWLPNADIVRKTRVYGQNQAASAIARAHADAIICSTKQIHDITVLYPRQFDFLCRKAIIPSGDEYQMFRGDDKSLEPEARSKVYARHALLMTPVYEKEGAGEAAVGALFSLSQGKTPGYLKTMSTALSKILPTCNSLADIARKTHNMMKRNGKPHTCQSKRVAQVQQLWMQSGPERRLPGRRQGR